MIKLLKIIIIMILTEISFAFCTINVNADVMGTNPLMGNSQKSSLINPINSVQKGKIINNDDDDEEFSSFNQENIPQPENNSYVDKQISLTNKSLSVPIVSGNKPDGNTKSVYLNNFTSSEIADLKTANFNISASSPFKESDFSFKYTPSSLTININDDSLMKTNGAGTQVILDVKSSSGKSGQLTIGIWRNYVTQPYVRLDIGSGMQLQYMYNQDDNDMDPVDYTIRSFAPNFHILNNDEVINTQTNDGRDSAFYLGDVLRQTNLNFGYTRVQTATHSYEFVDPKNNQRLMAQSDYTVKLNSGTVLTFRLLQLMEPSSSKDDVEIKTRFINLTTDNGNEADLPSDFFLLANCNIELNNNYNLPIWFSDLISTGVNAGKPKGVYVGDTSVENTEDIYRFSFDFSSDDGPFGWGVYGGMSFASIPFNGTNDPGQKIIGNLPDTIAFNDVITSLSMYWNQDQMGPLDYGKSSPTLKYSVSASDNRAPFVRTDETELDYSSDKTEESLPNLDISGSVRDLDSSQVKVYYKIDDPVTTNGKLLSTVNLTSADNIKPNWVDYPGDQTELSTSQITDSSDLKTLADPSTDGHTIYVYAEDNGSPTNENASVSNVESINIPANGSLKINYEDADGNSIKDSNTIYGQANSTYDVSDNNYFPKEIGDYALVSMPSEISGVLQSGTNEATLKYIKLGTVEIQSAPTLDYGQNDSAGGLVHIKNQTNSLRIKDTTNDHNWKLLLSTTKFVSDNNSLTNIMKYLTSDGRLMNVDDSQSEVESYQDGYDDILNFDNFWWDNPTDKNEQIGGPMIQLPKNTMPGKYNAVLSWTVNDSL
ncbi:MucBP domain-containing protein [Companilactobacillus jidongensis]|uniref:MucBP domain-containing protein n=1 Tax=Companilactobacillus jidongensis TaxID=2486006 RepID=UPI000F78C565|nr:MucBP domain-containing protein [Companilactobacillus jidongensis]